MANEVRLARRRVLLGSLPVVGLALALAWAMARVLMDEPAAITQAPAPPLPLPAGTADHAASRVRDRSSSLEVRTRALTEVVAGAPDPGPVLDLLRDLAPDDAQLRAMALTALARWSEDARAREGLRRAAEGGLREERLVAISVLDALPGEWSEECLRALRTDRDPVVRDRARQTASAE